MRVITLTQKEFEEQCRLLGKRIGEGQTFDAIVGIATGGVEVAHVVASCLDNPVDVTVIKQQRDSTKHKENQWIKNLIRKFPRRVLDFLRIAESRLLELTAKHGKPIPLISIPKRLQTAHHILVVDDAIDSGKTMLRVCMSIKKENPHARLKTAVLTVTTTNPLIQPDYCLYSDGTLIRFPWSLDAK